MIEDLKRLRAECAATIARIDAILPQCEEAETLPVGNTTHPLESPVDGRCVGINQHAINRYRERTGSKKSDATIINQLHARLASADEWELKPHFRVIELLSHGQPARYFKQADLMMVVENETLVTVHKATADRWILKP